MEWPWSAELVDVFEHDDAGFDRDAEQSKEADAGGNAEMRSGEEGAHSRPPRGRRLR